MFYDPWFKLMLEADSGVRTTLSCVMNMERRAGFHDLIIKYFSYEAAMDFNANTAHVMWTVARTKVRDYEGGKS